MLRKKRFLPNQLSGMLLLLGLVTLLATPLAAQRDTGPYQLSVKRELGFAGAGIGSVLLGNYLRQRVPDVTLSELKLGEVPFFDRFAVRYDSPAARRASNFTRDVAISLPSLLLLSRRSRRHAPKLFLLYAETLTLCNGLTSIIKYTARRPRPYLYHPNLDPDTVVRSRDREAFLSGHTSGTAVSAFFFGRVFADYYPDSELKPYVWALAAGIPAMTGYLRIKAGKHYPSDVLAGYALGASIGWLVPRLHQKPLAEKNLTIQPTSTGFYLTYNFR